MPTADEAIAIAEGELGYVEGAGNRTKYGAWYGLDGQPWCDMFLSWVFDRAGMSKNAGRFAYTPAHALFFKQAGRWGTTPRKGALAFFDFPDDGVRRISHVGLVTAVGPGYIDTIEGNTDERGGRTGGKVMRRRRSVGIVGYGYPTYEVTQLPPLPPPTYYPGDHMTSVPIRFKTTAEGSGYHDLFGVAVNKIISVAFNGRDVLPEKDEIGRWDRYQTPASVRIRFKGLPPNALIDALVWVAD